MDRNIPGICLLGSLLLFTSHLDAQTSSPFEPPQQRLGVYVVNSHDDLDTGCSKKADGRLVILIWVPATMNPKELDEDGYLKDPDKLINSGVIGKHAVLTTPAWDVDARKGSTTPETDPDLSVAGLPAGAVKVEKDQLFFNDVDDESAKILFGKNNKWVKNSFEIDIRKVKFDAFNTILVEIDVLNDKDYWCTALDWVAIEFDAAFPYVLAHGIDSDLKTWGQDKAPGVLTTLDNSGVLYSRFSTFANGSVIMNGWNLKAMIGEWLQSVKAEKVNIIAHSKGGLDSQYLASISKSSSVGPPFEVLSLSTLSTPHQGSVSADLQLLQRQAIDKYVDVGNDPYGHAQAYVNLTIAGWGNRGTAARGPQPPGLNDLTTYAASAALKAGIRANIRPTYTVGADAGPGCTRRPSIAEISPMVSTFVLAVRRLVEEALRYGYLAICKYSTVWQIQVDSVRSWGSFSSSRVLSYVADANKADHFNDIVVGTNSANPDWPTFTVVTNNAGTNHSEVKKGANVQQFLDRTIRLR